MFKERKYIKHKVFIFFLAASNKDARKRLQEVSPPINNIASSESSTDRSSRKNMKRKVLEDLEGNPA